MMLAPITSGGIEETKHPFDLSCTFYKCHTVCYDTSSKSKKQYTLIILDLAQPINFRSNDGLESPPIIFSTKSHFDVRLLYMTCSNQTHLANTNYSQATETPLVQPRAK